MKRMRLCLSLTYEDRLLYETRRQNLVTEACTLLAKS
jgi:hypothetical protein